MHRWPVVLVGAALLTSGAASQVPNPTRVPQKQQVDDLETWNQLAPYLRVIATYRMGETREAFRTILLWGEADLERDFERLVRLRHQVRICREGNPQIGGRTFAGEIEVGDLDAAVLVHTEAALSSLDEGSAAPAGVQLVAAHRLFDWTRDLTDAWSWIPADLPRGCHPPPPLHRRDWYLALTWTLLAHWEAYLADVMARRAFDAAPTDPEVLLAAGTVKEALAIDAVQFPDTPPRAARAVQDAFGKPPPRDAPKNLRDALALYQRALDTRPVYVQTHIRLGRVLTQLGQLDEGRAELEFVAANADAARERYLAELFLARVAVEAGDSRTAIQHYRRAIDAWPDSQAARLGLIEQVALANEGTSAARPLRELLSRPWPRSVRSDPWWVYPFGEADRGFGLLDELRRGFLNGETNGRRN